VPAKQYQFSPRSTDPRIEAEDHWADMKDALNATRDALEHSDADRVAMSAMIDMLRKELMDAKAACTVIERSNTVMRTKLQAAGMLVLDALKADEIERSAVVSEYKGNVLPMVESDVSQIKDSIVQVNSPEPNVITPPKNEFPAQS